MVRYKTIQRYKLYSYKTVHRQKQYMLQSCTLRNGTVSRQYVTKRHTDIMVRKITVHYTTLCYTIFKNGIIHKKH
jgi:hypothetical protein